MGLFVAVTTSESLFLPQPQVKQIGLPLSQFGIFLVSVMNRPRSIALIPLWEIWVTKAEVDRKHPCDLQNIDAWKSGSAC
jgi:hypothetical protein